MHPCLLRLSRTHIGIQQRTKQKNPEYIKHGTNTPVTVLDERTRARQVGKAKVQRNIALNRDTRNASVESTLESPSSTHKHIHQQAQSHVLVC